MKQSKIQWTQIVTDKIDWMIIGGESGNEVGKYRYRPSEIKWFEDLVSIGELTQTKVFVKQLGTFLSKKMGLKDRHGGVIEEFPENLQIREFPIQYTEQLLTNKKIKQ